MEEPISLDQLLLPDSVLGAHELPIDLAAAMRHHTCAVLITDHRQPNHPIVYVNESFEALSGYSRDELIGQTTQVLAKPDLLQSGIQELRKSIAAAQACEVVVRDFMKDRTPVWLDLHVSPIFSDDQQLTHYFGCMRDITNVVQQVERDRIAFAGLVHDLKNPLAAAEVAFGLILDGSFGEISPELRNLVTRLSVGHRKAIALIMNAVEHYRQEAGIDALYPEDIDLALLVKESVHQVEPLLRARHLRLKVQLQSGTCFCVGDRLALHRVVMNLLDNAIKFSPVDGIIELACIRQDEKVHLTVSDNGPGIPLEDQEAIFTRFKRCAQSERFVPGSGLGLDLCKRIAEAHGGNILLESTPGKGSKFSLVLPCAPAK